MGASIRQQGGYEAHKKFVYHVRGMCDEIQANAGPANPKAVSRQLAVCSELFAVASDSWHVAFADWCVIAHLPGWVWMLLSLSSELLSATCRAALKKI